MVHEICCEGIFNKYIVHTLTQENLFEIFCLFKKSSHITVRGENIWYYCFQWCTLRFWDVKHTFDVVLQNYFQQI